MGGGSDLRLWTVNGDLIGHVHCREIICSVAFSNQPEGMSVNVIAGGLENGVVRLWSTWDLKPVREITFSKSSKPIIRCPLPPPPPPALTLFPALTFLL